MDRRIAALNIDRMNRLAARLQQATEQLSAAFPLTPDTLDPDQIGAQTSLLLDGFRARFSDLRDIIGRTVFRTITQLDEDELPGQELTTRERIALMERRGIINADQWKDIREVRNGFAHEYPDQNEEKASHLNDAWEYVPELLRIATAASTYVRDHHGLDGGTNHAP